MHLTGPMYDHTSGSGSYVFVQPDGHSEGDQSRLVLHNVPGYGSRCLSFYYHAFGITMGNLSIYYQLKGQSRVLLWQKIGEVANKTYDDAGNMNGPPCIFPFTYKNKIYHSCTLEDSLNDKPWCITRFDPQLESGRCFTSGSRAWLQGSVELPPGAGDLVIEATLSDSRFGDLAVDDIVITEGKCPRNYDL
ncbi:MAM and LDL-receptor class A domain-containing protein 1 [Lingula anatina]|uniref:MAM and LDL-receptor class A domain-containing protein 1 n=1 Tax=Lingula anatina TaxID=7574 RepID=A0A2R2MRH8_LINAN|nr:MAM and LDL-receptor class A domain-containing protein 1 [Lingula anatina]|eukprot:XP_023932859.1 MAM and LDL-receptor class A domain-containing protein 1 [Lingula anatina]